MLSIRDNFLETIHGGRPDRFVKQFEYQPGSGILWPEHMEGLQRRARNGPAAGA